MPDTGHDINLASLRAELNQALISKGVTRLEDCLRIVDASTGGRFPCGVVAVDVRFNRDREIHVIGLEILECESRHGGNVKFDRVGGDARARTLKFGTLAEKCGAVANA